MWPVRWQSSSIGLPSKRKGEPSRNLQDRESHRKSDKMSQLPPSPPSEPGSPPRERQPIANPVPLDDPSRLTPIHELLPSIRIPSGRHPPHHYHPVTCAPLDAVEIGGELQQLRKEYSTSIAASKAREEAAKEVKRRIEEAEAKADQIQKLMKRKTEERDTERKVFAKMKREKERKT